mgnify:CR=1 FL=1
MQAISATIVEQTSVWLNNMDDEAFIEKLIDQIAEEQPFLFAYLVAMGEGDLNEDEHELLLFLGVEIWQMMSKGDQPLGQVSESHLDRLEQSNMQVLESLSGESEAEFLQQLYGMLEGYPQPEVLRHVMEVILEEETDVVRPSNRGIMIIFLKIVIDCLQESAEKEAGNFFG